MREKREEEALDKQIRELDARIDQYIDIEQSINISKDKKISLINKQGKNNNLFLLKNNTIQSIVSIPKARIDKNVFDQNIKNKIHDQEEEKKHKSEDSQIPNNDSYIPKDQQNLINKINNEISEEDKILFHQYGRHQEKNVQLNLYKVAKRSMSQNLAQPAVVQ